MYLYWFYYNRKPIKVNLVDEETKIESYNSIKSDLDSYFERYYG